MPRSQPDAQTLLGVAIDYLESEIYPGLKGAERYRTRIALNVLRIVQREITLGPAFDRQEAAGLLNLLGDDAGEGALERLTAQVDAGERPLEDPALMGFLRGSLKRALAVNNPRWMRDDESKEKSP